MNIDYKVIGNRIKLARNDKKMTQEYLAEQLGLSTAFLSRIERGSTQISLKRLLEICTILNTEPGYLLNGTAQDSNSYLNHEFEKLLETCPREKLRMIYDVIKVIAKY